MLNRIIECKSQKTYAYVGKNGMETACLKHVKTSYVYGDQKTHKIARLFNGVRRLSQYYVIAIEVRKLVHKNRRLAVLLLLAHVEQPAKTATITNKGSAIGFREIASWKDVSDILNGAADKNQVTRLPQGWQLLDPGMSSLVDAGVDMSLRRTVIPSDSVLPRELFLNSRGYIERVVAQINGSYDCGFFDCCAVMCRRLVETLIIEVYESDGRADRLKKDGHFVMLNGLLAVFMNDSKFNVGRNSAKGLEALKSLGDKSAHSRSFNARKSDIDHLRPDLRAAIEELLHLAKLI